MHPVGQGPADTNSNWMGVGTLREREREPYLGHLILSFFALEGFLGCCVWGVGKSP